jgi:hypothetical protein
VSAVASTPVSYQRELGGTPPLKDLAQARFRAGSARYAPSGHVDEINQLVDRYDDLRARFEARHGAIVEEYWSEHSSMAVVLTGIPRRGGLRLLGLSPRYSLHRSTEGANLPYDLEAALADGDTLAAKAALVLNGGAAVTVLCRIFEAHKFLLSAVDAEMGVNPSWPFAIRSALSEEADSPLTTPVERAQ